MADDEAKYITYARAVAEGDAVAGEPARLACRRFLSDLSRPDLDFKADKVARALRFIALLKHFRGNARGKPFLLEPWQQFIVANIVGFYWRADGSRRFTSSYIEVSRKNGKTALAAALCMYFLVADGEAGAEVDLAANSKEQAKVAYAFCKTFAKQLDTKGRLLRVYRDNIAVDSTASTLKVFAADDSKLDGFNASFGLIDEYHAAKSSAVRDVIKSSMGQRANPHLCTITTAGFDRTSPCYQLRTTAMEVLNGLKKDDAFFAIVYALDEGDDWTDPAVWVKATPNLGVTVYPKYVAEQVTSAKNNPSEEVGVKTKTLNVWCDAENVWIPDAYIMRQSAPLDVEQWRGKPAYIGVDLSAVSDLTAVAMMVEEGEMMCYKVWYYLPESCLTDKYNRELYREWARRGWLHITSGNVVDYDYITADLLRLNRIVRVMGIAYDKWNATQWAIDATERGLPLQEYSQALGNFNKPTKELERSILSGKALIDNNPITRWNFANVALKVDHNDNAKPAKKQIPQKIDGVIAMIEALGLYLDYYSY